ncbi:MAG: hypothetical protein K8S55_10145 [Phycisphaerae bacterium]|nr:hypothetical protein [Phycisphaerae bacterium]
MESLKQLFLEDPTYLYIALAVAELVLIVHWKARRTGRAAKMLLIPLVLAGGAFALERFVVTDREQLHQIITEIAHDAEKAEFDKATVYIAENYHGFGGNKTSLVILAKLKCKSFGIEKVKITNINIKVTGKRAEMALITAIHFNGEMSGMACLKWKIFWVKLPEGWQIIEITKPQRAMPGFG